jgi:hypothetical protein
VLGPCRSQGQRGLWILPRTWQSEMSEDPLNHSRVLDSGDQLHPPGAERPLPEGVRVAYRLARSASRLVG